jgi:hypothetical protein
MAWRNGVKAAASVVATIWRGEISAWRKQSAAAWLRNRQPSMKIIWQRNERSNQAAASKKKRARRAARAFFFFFFFFSLSRAGAKNIGIVGDRRRKSASAKNRRQPGVDIAKKAISGEK